MSNRESRVLRPVDPHTLWRADRLVVDSADEFRPIDLVDMGVKDVAAFRERLRNVATWASFEDRKSAIPNRDFTLLQHKTAEELAAIIPEIAARREETITTPQLSDILSWAVTEVQRRRKQLAADVLSKAVTPGEWDVDVKKTSAGYPATCSLVQGAARSRELGVLPSYYCLVEYEPEKCVPVTEFDARAFQDMGYWPKSIVTKDAAIDASYHMLDGTEVPLKFSVIELEPPK